MINSNNVNHENVHENAAINNKTIYAIVLGNA